LSRQTWSDRLSRRSRFMVDAAPVAKRIDRER